MYINKSSRNLWHVTPAYIFKLYIDRVDMYTYFKSRMLLELLSVHYGLNNLTSETIYNDLQNTDFHLFYCDDVLMTLYCTFVIHDAF